jgi:hypothetical protein
MTTPPVFGDFLGPATEHIAAAVSFRGELPYDAQRDAIRHLNRLVATLGRYLADLSDDPGFPTGPERYAETPVTSARLALRRAAQNLRPAAAAAADTSASGSHPAAGHLSAAADHLAAGRDLLNSHFTVGTDGTRTATSHWAPVIAAGPVISALLGELAGYMQQLAPWIERQSRIRRVSPGTLTSAHLALRGAEPWLHLAGTAIRAAQQAHYPLPARSLLDAIPANTPPPRQAPGPGEPVHQLCERIPLTAERLRYAAFAFTARGRWSPAAASVSWRRDALASAITSHASEFILRTLAERAGQLGLEPAFKARLHDAANQMAQAWTSWRAVAGHWDIVTTGTNRGSGLTPVATEISDLVLRTGRLAYRNPHWTPDYSDSSLLRAPADLAHSPGDVITVLAAIHNSTDAITRIATADHQAVLDASTSNRLYVPTRVLPENYDIPHPYAPAPRAHSGALLHAYDTAIDATTRTITALDNLATAVNAPSSLLTATRRASAAARQQPPRQQSQRPAAQPPVVTPVPGRTEQALRKLRIRDPALLLRAAVIDQAARDLVTTATAKAHSRDSVAGPASRLSPRTPRAADSPTRVASQDTPITEHPVKRPGAVTAAVQPNGSRPVLQQRSHVPRSADQR